MTIFPASRLVQCLIALGALAAVTPLLPVLVPFVAALAMVVLIPIAMDYGWLRKNAEKVSLTLSAPTSAMRGETILSQYHVANELCRAVSIALRPMLPAQGVPNHRIAAFEAAPAAMTTIEIPVQAPVRGEYVFGDVYARITAPLAMLQAQRIIPALHRCKIMPDIRRVKEYIVMRRMRHMAAPHIRTTRLRGIGSEFESLRDYEDGDDIRRIDWLATAKHSKFIVRNYEIEQFRNVVIAIDRGRLMTGRADHATKLDFAIDATLMMAAVALDSGDRCGMLLFDETVAAYHAPRQGMGQLQILTDALYDVQPNYGESHFRRAFIHLQSRLTKRSLVVILSDVVDVDASASLINGVLSLSKRHLVVFAALRTPEIEGVIEHASDSPDAPFRKAVAYRLKKERTEVMAKLQKGGVYVLDVKPDELTVPLVNKYIELREQNML